MLHFRGVIFRKAWLMRRVLFVLAGVIVALSATLLLALRSESFVLNAARWTVERFSEFTLELVNPHVNVYAGELSADQLHLKPKSGNAPALLSVLGLDAMMHGEDRGYATSVSAESVLIYVSDSDNVEDPQPLEWLGYLSRLPTKLNLEQVHLITETENTWIFPLKVLRGSRQPEGNYRFTADADYEGEPLGIALDLLAVDRGRGVAAAETNITFTAPVSGSEMKLAGRLEGSDQFFHYNFNINASFTDIREVLKGFDGAADLTGALALQGTVVGDTTGFVLSDATFKLDNMPEYSFNSRGWLNYRVSGESGLELTAEGELASVEYLVNWLGVDLGELGAAQSNIRLIGSLDKPVIDSFKLVTGNDAGLIVSIGGRLNLYGAVDDSNAQENSLAVELEGPSLAVLQEWLGELPFETGQWHASGLLTGYQGNLSLANVTLQTGTPETVELRASGAIGSIINAPEPDAGYIFNDIAFMLEASTPDSGSLARLLQLEGIPPHQDVRASADISGTGEELQLANGQVLISSSDLQATIGPISAVVRPTSKVPLDQLTAPLILELSDTSTLSQYIPWPIPVLGPLKITARVAQNKSQYQLLDLVAGFGEGEMKFETKGRVGNLADVSDVSLTTKVIGLESRTLLATVIPSLSGGGSLGKLGGFFRLTEKQGQWTVADLELASGSKDTAVQLAVNGEVRDITGNRFVDLAARFRLDDQALIASLVSMSTAPISGSLKLRSSQDLIRATLRGHVGTTSIAGDADVTVSDEGISRVSVAVETPHLHLQDFGVLPARETVQDQVVVAPVDRETLPALIRRIAPAYPVDMSLKVGRISGDYSSIDSLEVRISGQENRYTLEQFSARYKQAPTEIRGVVDLNPDPPALSLAGQANAIPLGGLLKDVGVQSNVSGALTVQGGITVMGDTRESLVASLNGSVAFALEDAIIEGAAYDLLATDLLAWIYSGALTEKSTHIDCTMARFQLSQGVATSDSLYIESARMIATGTAKFDLVNERMDLRITPKSRSRLFQVPSEVRLKGDISNPEADVSAISAVADATTSAIMLIPSLTLKLFGLDSSSDQKYRPCQAGLGS